MKHDPAPLTLDPEACVTASDLVRQFGAWQERAIRNPVFVLRRGRPSLVVTSIDLMRRLCAVHRGDAKSLLDAMDESVLTIDAAGTVRAANRAARQSFADGVAELDGMALSHVLPGPVARFVLERAATLRSNEIEQLEIEIGERLFRISLTQGDDGTLMIATDTTDDARFRTMASTRAALAASIEATGIGTAQLDIAGRVLEANAAMTSMMGGGACSVVGMKLAQLTPPRFRAPVEEAIERTVADGGTHLVEIEKGVDAGRSAQLALSGIRVRSTIEGIAVAIRAYPTSSLHAAN